MSLFDLLFLLVVLLSAVVLITAAVVAISGRGGSALRILRTWAVGAGVYLAIAWVSHAALPLKTFHLGDEQCEDDWCLSIDRVSRVAPDSYRVAFRMISHALRVDQRNRNGAELFLVGTDGRRYASTQTEGDVPIDVLLHPGETIAAERVFKVPAGLDARGVVFGSGHTWLPIIGREPFQKTMVVLN